MLEWLPWTDAAVVAGGAAATTVALRRPRRGVARAIVTWTRELTIMFFLYALWQLAGDLSVEGVSGATGRGRAIWRAERWLGLPSEASLQRLVLPHRTLIHLCNLYYVELHVPVLGVCLVWLFVRHRDRYPSVRNVLALVTGASLLIQLIPVAPPRLIPALGVVDTGRLIGPSTYPATVAPGLDQLSAMPSLHVGWALIVAGSIIWSLRSRWRWLAIIYPALTWSVVVVTGNHYWLDGAASLGLVVLAVTAVGGLGLRRARQEGELVLVAASMAGPATRSERPGYKVT